MVTTIHYIRNTESSQGHGDFGTQYAQHVEPHGRYISQVPEHFDSSHLDDRWERGVVTFHNPKHMDFGGGYEEPDNWKHRLSAEYGGKTGRDLSDAVRGAGHDGIITHDKYGTSEIVDLTHPKPARRRKTSAAGPMDGSHKRFRCPCGVPVEYDLQDGWQHADGSIGHDGGFYPHSVSDLMERRAARRLGNHVPAVALYDSPSRWRFKQHEWDTRDRHNIEQSKQFGEYTLHAQPKYEDGDRQLHVTTADGQHVGEAYTGEHPTRPGHIELAPEVHPDHRRKGIGTALYDYAEELAGRPAAPADSHTDAAEAFWQHRKQGRYSAPRQRLFGPTYGLDTRLFDGDKLRPEVRASVIRQFTEFCERHGYREWPRWAKIVFFGSEASEWTAPDRHGNNDFDLSIGLFYFMFRLHYHPDLYASDEDIAARFTQEMHAELNDPQHRFPGVEGVYDQTWFANLKGWDIAEIRPYAAYDVVEDEWIVRPPHLPDWSMKDFPEGPGLAEEVRGIVEAAEGILAMPEPYRTQNGAAFWEFVHANRSNAFGPEGEGWWDPRNVIEKALDQKGLMQRLFECHRRATEDPTSLAAPADWSNTPIPAR